MAAGAELDFFLMLSRFVGFGLVRQVSYAAATSPGRHLPQLPRQQGLPRPPSPWRSGTVCGMSRAAIDDETSSRYWKVHGMPVMTLERMCWPNWKRAWFSSRARMTRVSTGLGFPLRLPTAAIRGSWS